MLRDILTTIIVLFAAAVIAHGKPMKADMRLDDGSTVRMAILHDSIDVQTKYGKLTIPMAEIRKIEFGLNAPAELEIEIAKDIKLLGSTIHKERERASLRLESTGLFAVPALMKRTKMGGDKETQLRAAAVLERLGHRLNRLLFDLPEYDTIHTGEGTIRGRVLGTVLKSQSDNLGELPIKLSSIRHLTMATESNAEIVLTTKDDWTRTDVSIHNGYRALITATGSVDLWPNAPGSYTAGPKGYNTPGRGGQFMAGALVGKIGENGKEFFIGDRLDEKANEDGMLFIRIVSSPWNNSSLGQYIVSIRIERP